MTTEANYKAAINAIEKDSQDLYSPVEANSNGELVYGIIVNNPDFTTQGRSDVWVDTIYIDGENGLTEASAWARDLEWHHDKLYVLVDGSLGLVRKLVLEVESYDTGYIDALYETAYEAIDNEADDFEDDVLDLGEQAILFAANTDLMNFITDNFKQYGFKVKAKYKQRPYEQVRMYVELMF